MATLDLDREWRAILDDCPPELSTLAKQTGAVQRWRQLRSGAELLQLALRYAAADLSLRATAAVTTAHHRAVADTSVLDRLRAAPPFLDAVLTHVLADGAPAPPLGTAPLRLVDATMVSVPGSTGSDWRVHAQFDPTTARLRAVEVTDVTGGETLRRTPFRPGDVVVGDRGLGTATGLHHLARHLAYGLLRVYLPQLAATACDGHALRAAALARRARRGDRETAVWVRDPAGGPPLRARLLVAPLPRAAAQAARARTRREARKKGGAPGAEALALAGLLVVVTTLPATTVTAAQALRLYRARYQVELFFKRAKSLLDLDRLRAHDPALVRAYLLAKLITIALVERRARRLQGFSPLRAAA